MKTLLFVGIGGFVGSILRYLVQIYVERYTTIAFPFGTLLVNLSGCFAIGLLYGMAQRHAWLTIEWRLLLVTGVCGGYTTFSSFSYESFQLLREASYGYFALYILGSVTAGLLATFGGYAVAR